MTIKEIGSKEKPLSWTDFEDYMRKDADVYNENRQKERNGATGHFSRWIYRGQTNADWFLETTLERYLVEEFGRTTEKYDLKKYYSYLSAIVPSINSLTKYKFKEFNPWDISLEENSSLPHYELLCYARHHGFPSPLLDWSMSYYVAAFFAFRGTKPGQNPAIYAYQCWAGKGRSRRTDLPFIDVKGPYVETHPRHHKQQSQYTVCASKEWFKDNAKILLRKHDEAVSGEQIKKFILNFAEKKSVLEKLFS
ncbi:MAG: FRG domain-containing protein [Rhodomicrobium sp.]|nr:FRG domain-containing protein [Rhodomicrobium sp.]